MELKTVGLLHPGAMGSSIGAAAKSDGKTVLWASEGRSDASATRARSADLLDAKTLENIVSRSDIIISVCPPAAALDVANTVFDGGFSGIYLDANAVSPRRSREIGELAARAECTFIDGGIVGGPAWKPGTTWMYVSGSDAHIGEKCFAGSPLTVVNLKAPIGSASALKMAYAAYTKGSTALICGILALAEKEGVVDALFDQWKYSQKTLAESAENRAIRVTQKAWRFAGEMREIAQTFQDVGLPGGFHNAAAEVYERLAGFKDADPLPDFQKVMDALSASHSD